MYLDIWYRRGKHIIYHIITYFQGGGGVWVFLRSDWLRHLLGQGGKWGENGERKEKWEKKDAWKETDERDSEENMIKNLHLNI